MIETTLNGGMTPYIDETPSKRPDGTLVSAHSLDTIRQNERLKIIIDELIKGTPKRKSVLEYSEKWDCNPKTIKNLMTEAITNLHFMQSGNTIEELRSEQVAKLEELYSDATISEKLKIIDLVSDTLGLYDNNLTVKTSDEIKINLGV